MLYSDSYSLYLVVRGRPRMRRALDVHGRWVAIIHPAVLAEISPHVLNIAIAPPPTAALVAFDEVLVRIGVKVYVVVSTVIVYG